MILKLKIKIFNVFHRVYFSFNSKKLLQSKSITDICVFFVKKKHEANGVCVSLFIQPFGVEEYEQFPLQWMRIPGTFQNHIVCRQRHQPQNFHQRHLG